MSFKNLLPGSKKGVVDYSARSAMIAAPPPGHVTDRNGRHTLVMILMMIMMVIMTVTMTVSNDGGGDVGF